MEQLKLSVKFYIITEDKYPESLFIENFIDNKILNTNAIKLKNLYSFDVENLSISYNDSFDCDFMFENLYDYVDQYVKNDTINCKNNKFTFLIN